MSSSKRKRDDSDDERSSKKHKKEKKSKKSKSSKLPKGVETISEEDFYRKGCEFREWLLEEDAVFAEDLETADAKYLFRKRFVKYWNSGELSQKYYDGLAPEFEAATLRTQFRWPFHDERPVPVQPKKQRSTTTSTSSSSSANNNMNVGEASDEEDRRDREKKQEKFERKKFFENQKNVEEELVPKKDGRERMLEKRREKGAYARNNKEVGGMEMNDSDIYGSSKAEFDLLKKKKEFLTQIREQAQEMVRKKKLIEYQQKEQQRMQPIQGLLKVTKLDIRLANSKI